MAEINELLSPKTIKQMEQYQKFIIDTAKEYGVMASSALKLEKVLKKEEKTTTKLNTRQKEAQRLRNGMRSTIAKQEQAESRLNKELIKSKLVLQEQTKQLKEQARQELGLKKRSGLFANMTKSILTAGAAIGLVTGALKLLWKGISRTTEFQVKWERSVAAGKASLDVLTVSLMKINRGGFKDFRKRLKESQDAAIELTRRLQILRVEQIALSVSTNKATLIEGLYASVAEDATKSFQKREESRIKAFDFATKRAEKELQVAKQAFEDRMRWDEERKKQGRTITEEELSQTARIKIAYDNAKVERKRVDLQYNKLKRELDLDNFEQELDFIFDVADKRKTANEKIIADETKTFSDRQKLLDETNKLLNDSFDDQINIFNSENKINIDRNKLLKLNNKESFEYARSLGMSERATNRLLEVIRERIAAISDLEEAQKSINKSIRKSLLDDQKEINKQSIGSAKELQESILNIESEIERELDSQHQKELKNFTETEKNKTEALKEQEEARRFLRQQSFNQGIDLVNNLFTLQSVKRDAELQQINDDYDARIERAEGNEELQERLEKQRAQKTYEIELQQAKAQKNQALFNVLVSTAQGIAQAWASSMQFGPAGPAIAATLTGLMVANAAVQTAAIDATPLPSPPQFALGTDYSPSTFIAGEAGRELMFDKSGQAFLTPNKATLYTGMEGTQILPNAQTEAILKATNEHAAGYIDTQQLGNKLDAINEGVRQIKMTNIVDMGRYHEKTYNDNRKVKRLNRLRN